ncbi:MAG: hypothetical protein KFB93_05810 [Simkaniaceae bacterium]|nr:MAG: hypothetical protein KFB93_05810 [Simkaniaceae bacterium]
METLSRDSSLLDYTSLSTKGLNSESTTLQNPWENDTSILSFGFSSEIEQAGFNQDNSSLLLSIYEVALGAINLVGALFEGLNDCFHELSQCILEVITPTKEKSVPNLVQREFSQIDRKSLLSKLKPILGGDQILASMISSQIVKCGSYSSAIDYLTSEVQAKRITDEQFATIQSELYSEVK